MGVYQDNGEGPFSSYVKAITDLVNERDQYKAECDRLRAERDNLAAAIERVRKECDAVECELAGWNRAQQLAGNVRVVVARIRSSIGSVGQQTQEGK